MEEIDEFLGIEETECDYCNCALRDCSLCHVGSFDNYDDDTPIC